MTNAPVDPRLVEFVRQRRKAASTTVDPKMVDFVRQRRAAKNPPVNVVGMPVLPGDADYERVQHENRVYQNTKEYGDPFEGSPGMIAKRFGEVVATGGKGVLPAAYDSTIGATARGLGRVSASVAEGTGLASKERADQTRAVMDTYAQNEARTAAQTPGGSVGSFVGPAALSAAMILATRTPASGAVTGAGLGIYGLSSADQGMAEYRATRQQQGKEANPWEELAVGAGYGAAEILFERIGLDKTGSAIRSVGQNMADAVLRRDSKALAQIAMSTAESVGVNMTEEGATQYAQNIIDSTFDPNQDINEGVRSSMIGGGLQGLMFAGPGGAVSAAYHGSRLARDWGRTVADVGRAVVEEVRPPAPAPQPTTSPVQINETDVPTIVNRLEWLDYAIANPDSTRVSVKVNGRDESAKYAAEHMASLIAERDALRKRLDEIAPAPFVSQAAQAAANRLRVAVETQSQPTAQTAQPPVSVATESPQESTGPLVPPGQQPSEQDLADARAIITRDPSIVTQPSRFRAEYLAARKRRAQPARPFAYTDNPDLATVLGADQLGLTNIRTRRENANAAQRYESGGSAPGAVAVRGPDVPAAPTPAVQDRAVPPADQGRGVESAAVEPAPASPLDRGVGEVVGTDRSAAGDQPGDVGVEPSVAAFLRTRTDDELRTIKLADADALDRLSQTDAYAGLVEVFRANPDAVRAEMRRRPMVGDQSTSQAPKQPWEMTRGEYRETDARLVEATKARDKSRENLGGNNRWGEARRFQGAASGNRIAAADKAQARWSKAYDAADASHRAAVARALSEGKPVPAEVLADYPDLAPNSSVSPDSSPAAPPSQAEAPAVNYADDIPINVAVGAFTNTSHTPEKRGQARREEYAATLKSAREELDKAAVTPEQKAIADAEFARYRDGMKRRMLDYLRAHSRVASAMITGPANFPTERNRKAGNAADKRLNELVDFDKRARAAMMKAVRGAATPEMMASEESARLEKRVQRFIDHAEDPKGGATSLFKSNLQGALERAAKNGETTAVANALRKLRDWQTSTGRTIFTNRSSIWKLADISEKAVEEAAAAPTGEQEVASYTDGTRVVRNFDDDRVRIFFPGKPSDAQRTTLKSRGFKWSPANGAWQRQNTANGYLTALDLMLGFGKQKNQDNEPPAPAAKEASTPQPPSTPDPATLPRPQLVRLAKERGVDTKGTKKEIAERVKAETSPDPAAKYQPRTRPWLSREAKRRGMNGSGTKDDLIAMLVASDQQRATVQQGATDGGTDTTPVGQVAGADQRWPGVRQGNKARNGVGSKGSQRGKGEAFRGEYSKSDIQRRLTQAVESSGYPIDDIETESFRAEELGIPEFSTSFAGDNLPGEIRDWLEGRGIAYRSLFTTGSSKMRGTGEDSFAALGSDRYFEIVEQLYSKARNIDKAARSLAKSGGYPDVSFFLWLSDRLPERQAERGPFEIVEASTIGDGQVVKILGTYFEGVKDPKWGGIQIIERGDGGEVIDRRALVIEPTLTTRIPIDAGSLSTAEQEFGPRESGTDDAPPTKRSDEKGVFGQQTEGIIGAQADMFGSLTQPPAQADRQDQYPGIRSGESVADYEKRMGTTDTAAMFDAIADRAKERLEKRAKKQGGSKTLNAGLNPEQLGTALRDTVDLSIVGAAKAAAAGVRAGRALTKVVDAAIAEMGRTVSPKVRAIIQKNVRKILAESGGDPDKFEKVVSDLYNAPVTKKDIRAQAKARKQAAASITNPGENAAPVSQADALRGRLKAAEQTGEKVAKSAATKIVQATRQGYQRGRRDERRTAIANMQGVVNDIKRERGRLRSLAQFEKRAGEVAVKMTADDARRAKMIRDGIRKQVVQYARTLPNEVRGRLVGRIATADTPVKMIQTVRALQRELMRHDGREAWGWIKKNARSTAVDKLKVVTNDLRKGVADLYAKAASAKRRIDAAETLKDSSIALAELQNLQAEIGLHITTASAAFKAIKGQRQQSAFQIATTAADIIAKRFAKRSGDGVSQIRGPKRWRVRKHLDSYNDLRNMLAELEGDDGPLFVAIWESLEEGSAEYSTIRRDMRAEMERSYIRAGFKSMADAIDSLSAFAGRGVEKKYTVTVGGESKTLSLGEISSLIAHNSDPETAALIASEFGMRFTSPEGTGNEGVIPTPNEIKAMAAAIEKDYKLVQLVDDFKAILEKRAPQTLRTVGEITGIEPRRVEKRWTRSRDMEMVPGMEDKPVTTVDPSMVNVIRSFAENMGIYEHRTQTTGIPILLKDVHSVMEEEIHKQAATLALARRVRDAMLILTQDQLGKAIINAKGVEFYRALKRQVMAAGRTEVVYATDAEKAVGFLKGSAAVKYLAANPSTYIGNLLGTLRVLPDVDARDYAAGIKAMTSMSRAELEQRSGYLWDRWEQQGMGRFGPSPESTMDARMTQAHTGFQAFLREIGRQVRNSMKNAGRGDLGAGLTNLRMGSAAFMQGLNWVESRIAAFTWGAMDAKVRREQPELSDKAREKVVEKFVRREVRETQNGGDPVDAASIATQNRSSAASIVMFLLSDVFKVRNRVKRAFRQSKSYGAKVLAAEAVGSLAKAYAVKYLWDAVSFWIAHALGGDDDKDRIVARMKDWTTPIERSAQDLFQILVPIGGPDLASLIDALRGRYNDQSKGGPVAMLAPLYDAGSAGLNAINVVAKSIENDDMNAEKIGLALAKFFDETTSAFGLNPLSPWTHRALREIVQTRKSEWW